MHLKGLDLNLLVVLDTLLAEKNITRTGERINLSQSATSGALARLREFFGDPLLIQIGQRMELTPMAEKLAQPVREIILKGESLLDKNQGFRPETSTRTFRLNMSDYAAAVILTGMLGRLRELAPQVRIEISSIVDEPTIDYLDRGYLDLIIGPTEHTSPLHPSENLFDDQFVAVVWSGNQNVQHEMTLENYLSLGHIVARFGKIPGWAFDEVFIARSGYHRRIDVVASSFSMLINQVIGTQMVATAHERFAQYYAQYLPIKVFPAPIPIPPFKMKMQWHRFHDSDAGIQWLRQVLREGAEGLGPLTCSAGSRKGGPGK